MKKIVFTEEYCSPENLFPFTLTRQIQDIRIGILTIRQKWEKALGLSSFDKFENDYKDIHRGIRLESFIEKDTVFLIHGNVLPTPALIKQVKKLKQGEFISLPEKESIVYCIAREQVVEPNKIKVKKAIELDEELMEIRFPWDITQLNGKALQMDLDLLKSEMKTQKISSTNKISGKNIFIEKGAKVEHCYINAEEGPVFIGKDALVMEGSMIKGPVAVCEGATVKMGAKIYGASTIGPNCVAGGEIKNSVMFANSNKAHDGYLGDSVIGEWCNLGAGTSNSNLKNNASDVCIYTPNGPSSAGKKCGMMMGDYSRTAINTSVNTGTVIGVCTNVFGSGLTPKYIPSFSWGSEGVQRYRLEKAYTDIENWKGFKGQTLEENEKFILKHIFDHF